MLRKRFSGLKVRLFVIVMLAMVPVLCMTIFMALDDYATAKAEAVKNSHRLTRAYAATGSALVTRAKQLLEQMAARPQAQNPTGAACARLLADFDSYKPLYHSVGIVRADGVALCTTAERDVPVNLKNERWFQQALRSDSVVVGHYADANGAGSLPLALRIPGAEGAGRHVLTLSLDLSALSDVLDDQPLPNGATASIVDRDGTILARYPSSATAVGRTAPGEEGRPLPVMIQSGEDSWEAVGLDGVRRLYLVTPVAGAGANALFLRLGISTDAVYGPARQTLIRNLCFITLMSLLVLLATWTFSNRLVLSHISKLWVATSKLSEGNYAYRIGAVGGGELGDLALAFDQMAGVLEDRAAKLSSAESKYRDIFENSVTGIFQATSDGRLLRANRAMARMLGYANPQELIAAVEDIGKDIYTEPERRATVMDLLERQGAVAGLELPARHISGSEVWLSMDARVIRGADGQVAYYEAMVSDITLRKRIESELSMKQEKLQALLEYSPTLISIKDANGRYVLSNRMHQEARKITGQVLGRSVEELYPPEVAKQLLEEDRQVLAEGRPITYERPLTYDDELRYFVAIKFPLLDEKGRPHRVGSITYDVTDLERVREALRESEEKFRTMIQTSPDLIWMIDPQGVLVEVNSGSRELIGYEPEELRGRHFHQFFYPEDLREHDRDQVLPLLVGQGTEPGANPPKFINERRSPPRATRNLNLRLIPKNAEAVDGRDRRFELSACGLWRDMRFIGSIVVIRDVTERRRAEAELRRSRELLRQTQAIARIGGFVLNLDTGERNWTEEACALLRLEGGELPDFRQDAEVFTPDGQEALKLALERREDFDLELQLAARGGTQPWVRMVGRCDDGGNGRLVSGTIQDITDRKELELLRGDIDSIVRHDLKAPLNGIINLPQLMKSAENLTPSQVEFLQFIEDCGRNMLRQIDMSLDLMKIERGQYECNPAEVDLVPLLREILNLTRDTARLKLVDVLLTLDDHLLEPGETFLIWGEARLCYPLLTNLVVNAVEASPFDSRVDIRMSACGDAHCVAIRNMGEVPMGIRERFFQKYATSGKTTGTGLGTYSALLFARAQGGVVELDASEPGATSVLVRLPRRGSICRCPAV